MHKGIEVKRFAGVDPSIGYTDFRFVYLSWSLSGDEYDTAFIHEAGHIWLQHQYRGKKLQASDGNQFDVQCWLLATDMEIARHLYTPDDERIITRPRSALNGGITSEHTSKYPHCVYAEDYYAELKKEKDTKPKCTCHQEEGETQDEEPQTVDSLIEQAKKEVSEMQNKKQLKQAQKKSDSFRPPKPSLASEIDRHLGRTKVIRASSYKRPPRRESSDFIKKGVASTLQTPRMTLYVDRSGSFDATKTATATNLIEKILLKYRGRINHDVIYFNDTLLAKDPLNGSGGTNYNAVIDNIIRDRARLSIIITDDDSYTRPDGLAKIPATIVIPVGTKRTNIARVLNLQELL